MLDWQKRLLDEAADMNEKVENLEALLDLIDKEHLEPLPEEEVLRLRRQHIHIACGRSGRGACPDCH